MRRFSFALAAVLLAGSVVIHAPNATASDNTRVQARGVVLSGELSRDGRTLVADDDNQWAVSNADMLKGLEGRYVTVRCRMDPKSLAIRVLSILDQPDTHHAPHLGDAAFRR